MRQFSIPVDHTLRTYGTLAPTSFGEVTDILCLTAQQESFLRRQILVVDLSAPRADDTTGIILEAGNIVVDLAAASEHFVVEDFRAFGYFHHCER